MNTITLRRHALGHIPEVRVDPSLLRARFPASCSMARCQGRCCASGVWIDAEEHARVVRHAEQVQASMDPLQERDPGRWFDDDWWSHPDFPSGRAVGTSVVRDACVFLDATHRCVLEKASTPEVRLRPFYCVAFPITVEDGVVCLDEGQDAACCVPGEGAQDALALCAHELEHVLGAEGVAELRARATTDQT